MTRPNQAGELLRPIIGIENRTALEVFDMMCDRFRFAHPAQGEGCGEPTGRVKRRIEAGLSLIDTLKSEGAHLESQTVSDLVMSLRASNALNSVLHRDLGAALHQAENSKLGGDEAATPRSAPPSQVGTEAGGMREALADMRAWALEMIGKHADPNGTDYEQGQQDMGHRWVKSIDERLAALQSGTGK